MASRERKVTVGFHCQLMQEKPAPYPRTRRPLPVPVGLCVSCNLPFGQPSSCTGDGD